LPKQARTFISNTFGDFNGIRRSLTRQEYASPVTSIVNQETILSSPKDRPTPLGEGISTAFAAPENSADLVG
jgi:hypothetical protein